MDAPFASLLVEPPTVRCIGVQMLPLSLGHQVILQAEQSPFVVGGRLPMYDDLIVAAFVCAHTWKENQTLRRSPFRRWIRAKVWGKLSGNFDVAENILALASYIRDADEIPEQKASAQGSVKYLFSDWTTRLYKFLRSIGMAHIEAMDTPMIVANRLFIAHLEENTSADFKTSRNDPVIDAMSRMLEKLESGEVTLSA